MLPRYRILLVDDQWKSFAFLPAELESEGIELLCLTEAAGTLEALRGKAVDALLLDLTFDAQEMQGEQVFREVRAAFSDLPVLILTVRDSAIAARHFIAAGAAGYLVKDADLQGPVLAAEIERVAQSRRLRRILNQSTAPANVEIAGRSRAFGELLGKIDAAALSSTPVLLTGEPGSGKSVFARRIHEAGPRRGGPLLVADCGRPSGVLEAELFGAAEAGWIEAASGGSLIVEDIDLATPRLKRRLALAIAERVVERACGEKRGVDARLIFTAERRLPRLGPRLAACLRNRAIHVPPLRRRHGDIPILAQAFLSHFGSREGRTMEGFTPEALKALEACSFPNNVRHLQEVVEEAASASGGARIEPSHLRLDPAAADLDVPGAIEDIAVGRTTLSEVEAELDLASAAAHHGAYRAIIRGLILEYRERWKKEPSLRALTAEFDRGRMSAEERVEKRLRRGGMPFGDLKREIPA